MIDEVDELLLEHFGTKGMRWGVRTGGNRVKSSSDYRKTVPYRNRKTHELTNKQISTVNNRITMEQRYSQLNPSKVKIGAGVAKGILAGLTTAASVYTLAKSPAGQAGLALAKNLLKKKA